MILHAFVCLIILLKLNLTSAHVVVYNDARDQILTKMFYALDNRMDELMSHIDILDQHGAECTYNVSTFVETVPSNHSDKNSSTEAPKIQVGDEPTVNLEDWLEELATLRQEVARNHFLSNMEQTIVHLFGVVLENAVQYAKLQREKNDTLKICNREKFLTCNYTEVTKSIKNQNPSADSTPTPDRLSSKPTIKGECVCYSRNDTDCDPEENAGDLATLTLEQDEEMVEKKKCHALRKSIHTKYVKELDLCMLAEQAFCPISPAYLLCEPGLSCITVDNHRHCDMENVAPLLGNLLGGKVVAFDYNHVDHTLHDKQRPEYNHENIGFHGNHRRRREAPAEVSSSPPPITTTLSENASLFAELQKNIKKHYVMRRIATNDIFCRCHKLFNCRDNSIACKAEYLTVNFVLMWMAVFSWTFDYLT